MHLELPKTKKSLHWMGSCTLSGCSISYLWLIQFYACLSLLPSLRVKAASVFFANKQWCERWQPEKSSYKCLTLLELLVPTDPQEVKTTSSKYQRGLCALQVSFLVLLFTLHEAASLSPRHLMAPTMHEECPSFGKLEVPFVMLPPLRSLTLFRWVLEKKSIWYRSQSRQFKKTSSNWQIWQFLFVFW